jgi:hypothetical protein
LAAAGIGSPGRVRSMRQVTGAGSALDLACVHASSSLPRLPQQDLKG